MFLQRESLRCGLCMALVELASSCATHTVPDGADGSVAADVPSFDSGLAVDASLALDARPPPGPASVLTFQYDSQRTGANRAETVLTSTALQAGRFGMDTAFAPVLDGPVYAQPLYLPALSVHGALHDVLYVATQANTVFALDALSGATLWQSNLGTPFPRPLQPCGNIDPSTGVLGTPVIDASTQTLYAVAYTYNGSGTFTINALDVATGAQRAGYPVPIVPAPSNGAVFDNLPQGERGALALIDARLYVAFGGLAGDCGDYHGWVVGIDPSQPTRQVSFAAIGSGSGIWAVGGPATDGVGNVFVTTGNSKSPAGTTPPPMGEYVLRLGGGSLGPTWSGAATDFFSPSNAASLDEADQDIGSTGPLVLPMAGTTLLAQGSKAGVVYLVQGNNLGGPGTGNGTTGEGAYSAPLFQEAIAGALAAYSDGANTWLFIPGRGVRAAGCAASGVGGVMALRVTVAAGAPAYSIAWCTATETNPNPPVVSSDGDDDAILWALGTPTNPTFTGTFSAYRVADGVQLWNATGSDLPLVRQWTPPVVANGRVYVTGPNTVQMYRLVR